MIMCTVPAQIAGVEHICATVSPDKNGKIDPHILTVAKMLDIDNVYRIGGAHAIASYNFV